MSMSESVSVHVQVYVMSCVRVDNLYVYTYMYAYDHFLDRDIVVNITCAPYKFTHLSILTNPTT